MKLLFATALATLSMAASQAQAQNDPHDPQKETGMTRGAPGTGDASFDELDVNKDGYLTKNEVMGNPGVAQNFARIDKDGDGKISPEEWKARGRHPGD